MDVKVSGKQVEIGEALPTQVRERLEAVISKHFDGGARAHAVFSHDGPFFRADCTVWLDSRVMLKAHGEGQDAYRSFGAALEHIEKQIRRYKRKLRNHHDKARTASAE